MTPQDLEKIFGELFDQLGLKINVAAALDDEVFVVNLDGADAR